MAEFFRRLSPEPQPGLRWVREQLDAQMDAQTKRLFQTHCQLRLDRTGRIGTAICLVATVVWWPLDPYIYGAFADAPVPNELFRLIIGAVCTAYLLIPRSPLFLRHVFWAVSISLGCIMAALSYTGGLLGGLEKPWFYLAYPALMVTIVFPLSLGRRVVATVLQGLGWMGGLLLFHPQNLASRYLPVTLSMLVLVSLGGIALGHYPFVLYRSNFLQSLALARDAAELETKVAEKTQALRMLLARLERAREEEREHISRDLHDELGQELTALRYALGLTLDRFRREPAAIEKNLLGLEQLLQRTTKTVRGLVAQLRPPMLEHLGLKAAAQWLAKSSIERSGLACQITCTGDDSALEPELASTAFRILQESLTNVIRHAQASRVDVSLDITEQHLALRVCDDGVGFQPDSSTAGMGILGMRERALALGSQLTIRSTPGSGTEVAGVLPRPVRPASAASAQS